MTIQIFSSRTPNAQDLVAQSMRWMDQHWDAGAGLLAIKSYENLSSLPVVHHIRETSWYALGLLQRGGEKDVQTAHQALQTLLTYQFDEPGAVYDGTWYRFAEEPHPGNAPIWQGYDPNWREFIGTTLALILLDYEQKLPRTLVESIDAALHKAIRGTLTRDLPASYTNIALMRAFLLLFAGKRFGVPAWVSIGERFANEIYQLFTVHNTFSEYNSPTYYGVDLYALGLWAAYSPSPLLQHLGGEMEQGLWKDIASMYHAGMKNMAGPFDRSYGMDLQRYVSTIGIWIWMAVGRDAAPFPDISHPFEHAHDFCFAPPYVAVGARIPEDALQHLIAFQGERQVTRVIADHPRRVATAWIGNTLLLGGEDTSYSPPASDQFHPATIHWSSVDARIGWIKLIYVMPVNASAAKDTLSISCISQGKDTPDLTFQVHTSGKLKDTLAPNLWRLPGLNVHIATNAQYTGIIDYEHYFEVLYTAKDIDAGATVQFTLTIEII